MWNIIFDAIKAALGGAWSGRNNPAKYRVKFKKKDPNGKWVATAGTVTSASVEAAGATFGLTLDGTAITLEARAVAGRHADVYVDGTLQPNARLANPKIHFAFPSMKTFVDYPFRPIDLDGVEHRIEVLYR